MFQLLVVGRPFSGTPLPPCAHYRGVTLCANSNLTASGINLTLANPEVRLQVALSDQAPAVEHQGGAGCEVGFA